MVSSDREDFMVQLRSCDDAMRALAFAMLGSVAAMDDVLQDAYLKAYRGYGSFRGESSFATWLHTIVHRCCLDHHQRQSREAQRRVDQFESVDGGEFAAIADPSLRFEDRVHTSIAVWNAIATLSIDHRDVLILVDRDGLTIDAAAEVLGVPRGTVGSRLTRARRTLRNRLERNGQGMPR